MTRLPHLDLPRRFAWLWISQAASVFGSALTTFAVTIWIYRQTGQATSLALMGFFNTLGYVVFSSFAGMLVDRTDRRAVMAAASLANGLVVAGLLGLFLTGQLAVWHVYVAGVLNNAAYAFGDPAQLATVSRLVPRDQLTRANGLLGIAHDGAFMVAPLLAGLLIPFLGVNGLMEANIVLAAAAALALVLLRGPGFAVSPDLEPHSPRFGAGALQGFRFIGGRPGLAGILGIFSAINLFAAFTYYAVMPAMILARSGQDSQVLGSVQSMLGFGGLAGGILLSAWGGPRKKLTGFLGATMISFLLGDFLFATGRTPTAWLVAAFASAVFIPFILNCYNAIWQTRVPAAIQGRVFAAKSIVQIGSMPLGYLTGGLLADRVFEPALTPGGSLSGALGWLVGSGPGAGMAAMFLCTAVLGMLAGLSGLLIPAVRKVEEGGETP